MKNPQESEQLEMLLGVTEKALTCFPLKFSLFSEDLYFREAWADAASVMGNDVAAALSFSALLMLKPDAVVGRRIGHILDFLASHGFEPLWAAPLRLDRHSMRELWRYDWHVYPVDRLHFCSLWYTAAEIVVFAVKDLTPQSGMSASARLSGLKGSSLPDQRNPGSMRSLLHPPNQVLNFIHVADEPMDVIREAGILLNRQERISFFASLGRHASNRDGSVEECINSVCARSVPHELDFDTSVARLRARGHISRVDEAMMRRCAAEGSTLGWDELYSRIGRVEGHWDLWDFITVVSALIPLERPTYPDFTWGDRC